MILLDSLDPELLPPRPEIVADLEAAEWTYAALASVSYLPGFDPVTEPLFNQIRELEVSWQDISARVTQYARNRCAELWLKAATFHLESLNDPAAEDDEIDRQELAELRSLHPELSMF